MSPNFLRARVTPTKVAAICLATLLPIASLQANNNPPGPVSVSSSSVDENQGSGTLVGTLSSVDPDSGDTLFYTLVNTGGNFPDNSFFQIPGGTNNLQTASTFDFENPTDNNNVNSDGIYTINVQVMDNGNPVEATETVLNITVNDVNETPGAASLTSSSVNENQASGTTVGSLNAVDPDTNDTLTYTFIDTVSYPDNSLFNIPNGTNSLQTAATFDFETQSNYSVKVRVTDNGNPSLHSDTVLSININNTNDAPTKPVLSNANVDENQAVGTTVGTLSTTDQDTSDTHTFTLASSGTYTDNSFFNIPNGTNTLQTAAIFDKEADDSYLIRVRVTDSGTGALTAERSITITINNVNEAPTGLTPNTLSIDENEPVGTALATLTGVDVDNGDTHFFSVTNNPSYPDNSKFEIPFPTNTVLTSKEVFDHETTANFLVQIQTTDAGGLTATTAHIVTVNDINEAPHNISLSSNNVDENQPINTLVGNFTASDQDDGDTHTFSLTNNASYPDNAEFNIQNNQLRTSDIFDHETKGTYTIEVRATDNGTPQQFMDKEFVIIIDDINDAPTNIFLNPADVTENSPLGTFIGNLTAADQDVGSSHSFLLVNGFGDNANFSIVGTQLRVNAALDYEIKTSHTIKIQTIDNAGATYTRNRVVQLNDVQYDATLTVYPQDRHGGTVTVTGSHDGDEDGNYTRNNTPEPLTCEDFYDITFTAIPANNYQFAGWTGDLPNGTDPMDPVLTVNMDDDKTVNAHFSHIFHKVDVLVYPDRHGYTTGGGTFLTGEQITVTTEDLPGTDVSQDEYVPFSHWRINGDDHGEQHNNTTLVWTVDEDLKIEAVYDIGLPSDFVHIRAGSYVRDVGGRNEHNASVSGFYMLNRETTKQDWIDLRTWNDGQTENDQYDFDFDKQKAEEQSGRNMAFEDPNYLSNYPITGITWYDMLKYCNAYTDMVNDSDNKSWTRLYYMDAAHSEHIQGETNPNQIDIDLTVDYPVREDVKWRTRGFRLPTEAEWERAARGGVDYYPYTNGNNVDTSYANFDHGLKNNPRDIVAIASAANPVRTPNRWGLYDMTGNAWEACWDWVYNRYYQNPSARVLDTKGPLRSEAYLRTNWRATRGGAANWNSQRVKIGYRHHMKTWFAYAITMRPVFPAPSEPDCILTASSKQPYLGSVTGGGVYEKGDTATLVASPISGASFVEWQDADGNQLGTNATLNYSIDPDPNTKVTESIYAIFTDGNPELYCVLAGHSQEDDYHNLLTVTGTGTFVPGARPQLTATSTDSLLFFAGWAGDVSGTASPRTFTINQNVVVNALFGPDTGDSDRDGIADYYERATGLNPFRNDSDGDRLKDGDEINIYGSDPTLVDTDNDGHDDFVESRYNTDPTDPNDFPFLPNNDLKRHFINIARSVDLGPERTAGADTNITAVRDRSNKLKNALAYNGITSFTEATGYNGATGSTARTIALWFQTPNVNSGPILSYGTFPNDFTISLDAQGRIQVKVDNALVTGTQNLADNGWHSVVVSVPGGATPAGITIYINGTLEPTTASGNTGATIATNSTSPVLMAKDNAGNFFEGSIDEIWLWERALAANEVDDLYSMEEPVFPDFIRPAVTTHPQGTTLAVGGSINLSVAATSKPSPTFQWQEQINKVWTSIPGATNDTFARSNLPEGRHFFRALVSNTKTEIKSRAAYIEVLQPPAITQQPLDTDFLLNLGGQFWADTTGSSKSRNYDWYRNSTLYDSTYSGLLVVPRTATQATHGGTWHYVMTNAVGSVTSSTFEIEILDEITITQHPANTGITQGTSGTISILATGGGTLQFQWQKRNPATRLYDDVAGANSANYVIGNMTAALEGVYRCRVSNGPGVVYSRSLQLTMYIPPVFTVQPTGKGVDKFGSKQLTTTVTGSPFPSLVWQKYNPQTTLWEDQIRHKKENLVIGRAQIADWASYRLQASNPGGTTYSDAVSLVVYYAPEITQNLEYMEANAGDTLNMTVLAHANARGQDRSITYQWYHNKNLVSDGNGVSGSNTATLTISPLTDTYAGVWQCYLTNPIGTTKSLAKKLKVYNPPVLTTPLGNRTLEEGKRLLLSARFTATKPYTIQWYKDNVAIADATLTKLDIRGVSFSDAGTYRFTVINAAGTLNHSANVTVTAPLVAPDFALAVGADTTSPDADADNDGLANLIEKALGSDPENPYSSFYPEVDVVEDGSGEVFISFDYTETKNANGLTPIVEFTTDLENWEPVDLGEAQVVRLDRGDFIQTTLYIPHGPDSRFFRIRVEGE